MSSDLTSTDRRGLPVTRRVMREQERARDRARQGVLVSLYEATLTDRYLALQEEMTAQGATTYLVDIPAPPLEGALEPGPETVVAPPTTKRFPTPGPPPVPARSRILRTPGAEPEPEAGTEAEADAEDVPAHVRLVRVLQETCVALALVLGVFALWHISWAGYNDSLPLTQILLEPSNLWIWVPLLATPTLVVAALRLGRIR